MEGTYKSKSIMYSSLKYFAIISGKQAKNKTKTPNKWRNL